MRTRTLVGVIVLMVVASACGDSTTTTQRSDATTAGAATTSSAATTSIETTTSESSTTTAVATTAVPTTETSTTISIPATTTATTTVEAAIADVEAWLADDFAASEPPEGVLGPSSVVCDESGPIAVGGVLACRLLPDTAPGLELDEAGIVIYVLDTRGHTAWTPGTDVPDSATGLSEALAIVGTDLMCRDLMDEAVNSGIFGGVGRPEDSAYFWSLVYWSLVGEPDRMDADLNGVPCETIHDATVIEGVLGGGPVW